MWLVMMWKKIFLWPGLASKGQHSINSVENRRNRKICCRLTLSLFTWPRLLIFYVLFTLPVTNRLRGVVSGGAGDAMATPDFCRSVNPISSRERADYAHWIILAPPDFQTFLRPWMSSANPMSVKVDKTLLWLPNLSSMKRRYVFIYLLTKI